MYEVLRGMEEQLNGATVIEDALTEMEQEQKPSHNLWIGKKSVRLADIQESKDEQKKGLLFIFVDSNGELMPSQFADQVGNIYVAKDRLQNFLLTAKYSLHMDAKLTPKEVLDELSNKEHEMYFTVNSSIKYWGMSFYNVIDWKQTHKA